jgi:hypothetical protein
MKFSFSELFNVDNKTYKLNIYILRYSAKSYSGLKGLLPLHLKFTLQKAAVDHSETFSRSKTIYF